MRDEVAVSDELLDAVEERLRVGEVVTEAVRVDEKLTDPVEVEDADIEGERDTVVVGVPVIVLLGERDTELVSLRDRRVNELLLDEVAERDSECV